MIVPHIISYKVRDKRISSTTRFDCCNSEKKPKQRGKEVLKKRKKQHQQEEQKKRQRRRKKIRSACTLVSLCRVILFLAWNKSRTHLGRRHRLDWDYFSVLQFWIEILIFLATILCQPKAPQILLFAQVHLATVTLKLDNRLYHLVSFGKNTCKIVISRLRYCSPLSYLPIPVVASRYE